MGGRAEESAALIRLAQKATRLGDVNLSYCPSVDDTVLAAFAPRLDVNAQVDISGCSRVTSLGLGLLTSANQGVTVKTERCWRLSKPSPALTAYQVVELQLLALGGCNGEKDAGIAMCFEYASPSNKTQTGPVERFGAMIQSSYSMMMEWESYAIGILPTTTGWMGAMMAQEEEDAGSCNKTSFSVVLRKGDKHQGFFWFLSKQEETGSWMTDSVVPAHAVHGNIE